MNTINYQRISDQILQRIQREGHLPSLLLHSCCAPCSTYVLEYLSRYFRITLFYYNPNIAPASEYEKRAAEVKRLVQLLPVPNPVQVITGTYENERFCALAKGLERLPEGGARCLSCYRLRLEETAKLAADRGFDYFTTTLSISPMKDAGELNRLGGELAEQYHVSYFYSDFKKREGYKRSVALSRIYELYRQNYCGCIYSKAEAEKRGAL